MRAKRIIVTVMLMVVITGLAAIADEAKNRYLQGNPQTEADVPRTEVIRQVEPGSGEQITPRIEAGLAQIEEQFRSRMQVIEAELEMCTTEEERDAIQQRAHQLKIEWTLALANRQLELARQRHDVEAEAKILQGIDRIVNPLPVKHDGEPHSEAGNLSAGGAR